MPRSTDGTREFLGWRRPATRETCSCRLCVVVALSPLLGSPCRPRNSLGYVGAPRIFEGSRLSSSDTAQSHLALLPEVLRRPDLPPRLRVRDVGELMGIDWQKSGKHITHHRSFEALVDRAGWCFDRGTGRKGSWFVRKDTGVTPETASSTCAAAPEIMAELG
jgi:hypothetical protein